MAQPEKSAKGHDRIGHPAAHLLNHNPFDAADLLAGLSQDRCPFNSVTRDKRVPGATGFRREMLAMLNSLGYLAFIQITCPLASQFL